MTRHAEARKIGVMKRLLLIPGVVLSTAAFFAAALELAARASTPDLPLAPGFGAVLRTLAPDLLDAARALSLDRMGCAARLARLA